MSALSTLQPRAPQDGGHQDEALRRAAGNPLPAPSPAIGGPRVAEQLLAIADHLTHHRPTSPMTEAAQMTLALHAAGTATASRPLLERMPWPRPGITRGEYALHLRPIARATATEPAQAPTAGQCPACNGKGGETEDTSSGGITRKTWKTCGTCDDRGAV